MKREERILLIIWLSIVAFCIFSCMTEKKATDYLKSKGKLAEVCADEYPVKDSVIIRDSITTDTLETFEYITDTLHKADTVIITKTLPAKVITKTISQVKEIYRENTARVAQQAAIIDRLTKEANGLRQEINGLQEAKKGLRKSRDKWFLFFLLALALNFRKPIINLIKKFV